MVGGTTTISIIPHNISIILLSPLIPLICLALTPNPSLSCWQLAGVLMCTDMHPCRCLHVGALACAACTCMGRHLQAHACVHVVTCTCTCRSIIVLCPFLHRILHIYVQKRLQKEGHSTIIDLGLRLEICIIDPNF